MSESGGMNIARRFAEVSGMLIAGDGLAAAVRPEAHVRLWMAGPAIWQRLIRPFERSPELRRAVGIAQVAIGIAIAMAAVAGEEEEFPDFPLGI